MQGVCKGSEVKANTAWMLLPPLGLDTFYDTWGKETSMEIKAMIRQARVISHTVLIQQRQSALEPNGLLHNAAIGKPRLLHDSATFRISHSEHQSKKIHGANFHLYVQAAVLDQRGCSCLLQAGEFECVCVCAVTCACVWLHRVCRIIRSAVVDFILGASYQDLQ